jgi:hypothetical protein
MADPIRARDDLSGEMGASFHALAPVVAISS